MLEGAKSAIRDGQETNFWADCWVDAGLRLIDFADTNSPDFEINSSVADMTTEEGEWNFSLIELFLQPEYIDLVAGMPAPKRNSGDDDWIWGCESSGRFTIKSTYNIICNSEVLPSRSIWKSIWQWSGPNRVRHFLWLAAKDRLLTSAMRARRGMSQDSGCTYCNAGEESSTHVLRDCSFAGEVWSIMIADSVNGADWRLPISEWLESHLNSINGLKFGIACNYLWRARNERIFVASNDTPSVVATKASYWCNTVSIAMEREAAIMPRPDMRRLGTRGSSAAGGLLRNAQGQCLLAYTINLGVCSITRAEIRGAIEGVRRAWLAGYRKLEIQLDSTAAVVILLNKELTSSHQYALEAMEFQNWLQQDWTVKVKHIYREANHAVDYLANLGHKMTRGTHVVDISDCNLAYFVRYDCMGISEPRVIK
ncbi:Putative ribonuclease H protein At1g65750 [Linum perenne]